MTEPQVFINPQSEVFERVDAFKGDLSDHNYCRGHFLKRFLWIWEIEFVQYCVYLLKTKRQMECLKRQYNGVSLLCALNETVLDHKWSRYFTSNFNHETFVEFFLMFLQKVIQTIFQNASKNSSRFFLNYLSIN